MFRHLISVSGIGPGTARMMLSSMTPDEVYNAIVTQDVNRIKSVKGIGMKTAQRVILELQDKIGKGASAAGFPFDSGVAPSAIRRGRYSIGAWASQNPTSKRFLISPQRGSFRCT